jgi:hypothetical protein
MGFLLGLVGGWFQVILHVRRPCQAAGLVDQTAPFPTGLEGIPATEAVAANRIAVRTLMATKPAGSCCKGQALPAVATAFSAPDGRLQQDNRPFI